MSIGTDISVADAFAASHEHDTFGSGVIEKVAVMLLSRHAHSVGVDLRKSLHVRGGIVDRDDSQWWFRQTVDQPFARSAEK